MSRSSPDQTREPREHHGPERVLTLVDKMAAREGENRSGLLARAALSYAERHSTQ